MAKEITIDASAMQSVVSKAILDGLTKDQRATVIEQAVQYLITPPKKNSYYDAEPQTPLQDAFDRALNTVVNKVAREVVEEDPALIAKVREMIQTHITDALTEEGKGYNAFAEAVKRSFADTLANFRADS